jgi:hypothetical protein
LKVLSSTEINVWGMLGPTATIVCNFMYQPLVVNCLTSVSRLPALRAFGSIGSCISSQPAFKAELRSPHLLNKHDVAGHLERYSSEFHLSVISSATIQSTVYSPITKLWTLAYNTNGGTETKTIKCRHLVQATGLGSRIPFIPQIDGADRYCGTTTHSADFFNAGNLKTAGAKVRFGRDVKIPFSLSTSLCALVIDANVLVCCHRRFR